MDKIFTPEHLAHISTKLGTKNLWVNEIQVCSNEGPGPFQGEMIAKMHYRNLKKSSPESLDQFQENLGQCIFV